MILIGRGRLQPDRSGPGSDAQRRQDLGVLDKVGTVEAGKRADLVVLEGDLTSQPGVIRKVRLVFKDGIGYDSSKLIRSVQGRVGIQ